MNWRVFLLIVVGAVPLQGQNVFSGMADDIVRQWGESDLICLGERHGSQLDADLRLALLQHPDFPRSVDAVVVEFANPIHQGLLDEFFLDLGDLSSQELSRVWRDATSPETWASPIYEEFLRALQDLNRGLPRSDRLRVLAGDARIDWASVETSEELLPLLNRGLAMRETISAALDQGLKVLAIFGSLHCLKVGMGFPGELSIRYPDRMWTVDRFFGTGAVERGSSLFGLGARPQYLPVSGTSRETTPAAGLVFTGRAAENVRLGRILDALVHYGDLEDTIPPRGSVGWDTEYEEELRRRRALIRGSGQPF